MIEWRKIAGFDGDYLVSNTGLVRSVKQERRRKLKRYFIMRPAINSGGYWSCALCKNGISSTHSVHQLVGKAFISNPENKHDINHKDGVKTNNHVDNLEWNTRSENLSHAYDTALRIRPHGLSNGRCKLSEDQVRTIRVRAETGESPAKIGKDFNVTHTTVRNIRKRKIWSHLP